MKRLRTIAQAIDISVVYLILEVGGGAGHASHAAGNDSSLYGFVCEEWRCRFAEFA